MKLSHDYFVYIIKCKSSFYYVGITNNLEERLWQHIEGVNKNCCTYKRRAVVLKYFEHFSDVTQAIAREKQLKGWGRKKKEALFSEHCDLLKELSQRKPKPNADRPTHHPSSPSG